MKDLYSKYLHFLLLPAILIFSSCSSIKLSKSSSIESINLANYIKQGEPLAIMPFETDNALSNLGSLVSDEVTANLLENIKGIKIIPTSITRGILQTIGTPINGIPDYHTIHSLSKGLKCRYLLTGNFYSSIGDVRYTNSSVSRIATGSVTIRLIDCDSAVVIWAKHVEDSYQTTSYYNVNGGQPTVYYTDGQLMQSLIKKIGSNVARYFYNEE